MPSDFRSSGLRHYAAFLRAVNVGGTSALKMDELRSALEDLGFEDVATVIVSGNVVFGADGTEQQVKAAFEACLADRFGLDTPVYVRSREQLESFLAAHPDDGDDRGTLYVGFLDAHPPPEVSRAVAALSTEDETLEVSGRELLWWSKIGRGRSTIKSGDMKRTALPPFTERKITTLRRIAAKFPAA